MKTVRIGMLGSGFVAEFYMQGLADVNGQEVVLNYSRSPERARAFARKWKIPSPTADLDAGVVVIAAGGGSPLVPSARHVACLLIWRKERLT